MLREVHHTQQNETEMINFLLIGKVAVFLLGVSIDLLVPKQMIF